MLAVIGGISAGCRCSKWAARYPIKIAGHCASPRRPGSPPGIAFNAVAPGHCHRPRTSQWRLLTPRGTARPWPSLARMRPHPYLSEASIERVWQASAGIAINFATSDAENRVQIGELSHVSGSRFVERLMRTATYISPGRWIISMADRYGSCRRLGRTDADPVRVTRPTGCSQRQSKELLTPDRGPPM